MNAVSQRREFSKTTISKHVDQSAPAFIVINQFGGLARFCRLTGYKTSTAWSWLKRGLIPSTNHEHILAVAIRESIEIEPAAFVRWPAMID